MDIIKTYVTNIGKEAHNKSVDSYKIITVNDAEVKSPFLFYDSDHLILNSKTLIKVLMLKGLPDDMLSRLFNSESSVIRDASTQIEQASSILYEDRIFFDFDPYNNFLLSKNSSGKDIKDIIEKTTNYYQQTTPPIRESDPRYYDQNQSVPTQFAPMNSHSELGRSPPSGSTSKIKHNMKAKKTEYDLSRMVNPYGLEKVVFTGGGTKGIIYIGAYIGLLTTGSIFYLNHFAGTSVGALTALVSGCTTPTASEYNIIKEMTLREILTRGFEIVERYQEAVAFVTERFSARSMDSFYDPPVYTFYGMWTALDTIVKNHALYDAQKSGFQIWYALICKKICQIMKNGLDKLIVIKKKDGAIVEFADIEYPYKIKSQPTDTVNLDDIINDVDSSKTHEEREIELNNIAERKRENEKLYLEYCGGIDIDKDSFDGWELLRFFTYQEYNEMTNKTLVMTGTKTKRLGTVYYTHTVEEYKNLSVMTGATASMSIPWVFKAPVINDSYNLDGGLFDNYPLTHCDKKVKDRITHYNNRIFGYLIDDKNSIIDAYEIIRELWLVYNGFIQNMNIGYLKDSPKYVDISELFFEIRSELYKLLYFVDVDLETFLNREQDKEHLAGFNIRELENIFEELRCHEETSDLMHFNLPKKGICFIEEKLRQLDTYYRDFESLFKIGRKTDLADVMELSVRQGEAYNILMYEINRELSLIENIPIKMKVVVRYEDILIKLMRNILSYYELKGTFIRSNDLEYPSYHFSELMKHLYKKITEFEMLTNEAVEAINKSKKIHIKNYINSSIQIALAMISKVLTRGSGNNIDLEDIDINKKKSTYMKAIDYFFHTDMTGIFYKYICIANDRICNDPLNRMRTIKLNTFETGTFQFNMDDELKYRLIYEGYSKTVKYFISLLHIMEITGRSRSADEYIESIELKYKKYI